MQSITPSSMKTSLHIVGRDYNITFQFANGVPTLLVDGQPILNVNDIQKVDISPTQSIRYADGVLSSNDDTVIRGVNRLYFYDGLLVYQFDRSKINSLPGSGRIYFNPDTRNALYTTSTDLMTRLERVTAVFPPDNSVTPEPIIATTTQNELSSAPPADSEVTTSASQEPMEKTHSKMKTSSRSQSSPLPDDCNEATDTSIRKRNSHSKKRTYQSRSRKTKPSHRVSSSADSGFRDERSGGKSQRSNSRNKRKSRSKLDDTNCTNVEDTRTVRHRNTRTSISKATSQKSAERSEDHSKESTSHSKPKKTSRNRAKLEGADCTNLEDTQSRRHQNTQTRKSKAISRNSADCSEDISDKSTKTRKTSRNSIKSRSRLEDVNCINVEDTQSGRCQNNGNSRSKATSQKCAERSEDLSKESTSHSKPKKTSRKSRSRLEGANCTNVVEDTSRTRRRQNTHTRRSKATYQKSAECSEELSKESTSHSKPKKTSRNSIKSHSRLESVNCMNMEGTRSGRHHSHSRNRVKSHSKLEGANCTNVKDKQSRRHQNTETRRSKTISQNSAKCSEDISKESTKLKKTSRKSIRSHSGSESANCMNVKDTQSGRHQNTRTRRSKSISQNSAESSEDVSEESTSHSKHKKTSRNRVKSHSRSAGANCTNVQDTRTGRHQNTRSRATSRVDISKESTSRSKPKKTSNSHRVNKCGQQRTEGDHFKCTGYIQDKVHPARSRRARKSDPDRKNDPDLPAAVPLTSTLNFELNFDRGHIYLSHKNKQIIDLSNPVKRTLTNSLSLSLKGNVLVISNVSGHIQKEYYGVNRLFVFNGTHVSEFSETFCTPVQASEGQLFINKDRAFYSSSTQFNMLLNDQLARVVSRPSDTMLMFQTLPGGGLVLLVNGEPVVTLSDAEVRSITTSDLIQYANNTIYVQDVTRRKFGKAYPGVTQFYVLNGISPGLEKYNKVVPMRIPGGGRLYVHEPSSSGFYSRNSQINNAITEHINSLSEPPNNLVFSIRYENNREGGNDGMPVVTVMVNGDEIVRLDPSDTEDQSLTLQHSLVYDNGTLFIMNGNTVAGAFIEVDELIVFDGSAIKIYKGSSVLPFPGGGQIFNSGFQGFYSTNTNLNDQIGEALLATVGVYQPVDSASSVPPSPPKTPSTVPPPHTSTTDHHTTDLPPPSPPQVIERSGNSKTATHLKTPHHGTNSITGKSPKPGSKTHQTGPSHNNQGLGIQPGDKNAHRSHSGKSHHNSSRQHSQKRSQSTDMTVTKLSPLTSEHHQHLSSHKKEMKTKQVQLLSTEWQGEKETNNG